MKEKKKTIRVSSQTVPYKEPRKFLQSEGFLGLITL
jgi:hypothetical protein